MMRNQATDAGSISSNNPTAMVAPMYCDVAPRTNSASGEPVRRKRENEFRVIGSVEQFGIGAADFLPQRLELEPAGQRVTRLFAGVGGVLVRDVLRSSGRHGE